MYKKLETGYDRVADVAQGGTATVYKYESRSLSRTPIAVKEITFEKAGKYAEQIWQNEIKFLRVLHSFGERNDIVKMQFAEEQNSRDEFTGRIIAFEWLGEDLERRLGREGPMAPGKAVDLISKVASALAFAHRQNIFHRDLSPRNIMFRSENDSQPVLIDFGLGREDQEGVNSQTVAGWKTPVYAPEKTLKPLEKDIYGLFAVYVRLLMDRPPESKNDFGELLKATLDEGHFADHSRRLISSVLLEEDFSSFEQIESDQRLRVMWDHAIGTTSSSPVISASFSKKALTQHRDIVKQIFGDARSKVASCSYKYEGLDAQPSIVASSDMAEAFLVMLGRIKDGASQLIVLDKYNPEEHGDLKIVSDLGSEFNLKFNNQIDNGVSDSREISKLKDALKGISKRSNPDSMMLEKWDKQLRLQELAIERFPKLTFKRVMDDDLNVVLQIHDDSNLGEIDQILDMTFKLDGESGEMEITAIEKREGGIRFEKRGFGKIPSKGELQAVLGPDENSINRQKKALEKLRKSFHEGGQLAQTIVSPDHASPLHLATQSAFEPELVNLDADKQEAVIGALKSDDLFVVKGPPGTGKTHLIAEFVSQILKRQPNAKILLVSQTHIAVDNALERIIKEVDNPPFVVRVGREESVLPGIRKFTIDAHLQTWLKQTKLKSEQWLRDALPAGIEPAIFEEKRTLEELQKGLSQLEELLEKEHLELSRALTGDARSDKKELNQQRKYIKQSGGTPAETLIRIERDLEKIKMANESLARSYSHKLKLDLKTDVSEQLDAELKGIHLRLQALDERTKTAINLQDEWTRRVEEDTSIRSVITDKASVVAGTCIGFLRESSVESLFFDYVIVDEASKANATEALVPALQGEKILFVGDNNQLPPMQKEFVGAENLMNELDLSQADVDKTLFDHLFLGLPSSKKVLLSKQYRMRLGISNLISQCFYDGKLIAAETVQEDWSDTVIPFSVNLIDTGSGSPNETSHKNSGYTNEAEADLLIKELDLFLNNRLVRLDRGDKNGELEVLVICAYAKQKELVLKKLKRSGFDNRVRVETVDASQGTEADVVYFLSTRSNERKAIGFLKDNRRVNVAMSRAKKAVFAFADIDHLPDVDSGLPKVVNFILNNPNECSIRRA